MIGKGGKFAVECVSNDLISWKCLFHLIEEVFGKKSEDFNIWKTTNFDEERVFFWKKSFLLFRRRL